MPEGLALVICRQLMWRAGGLKVGVGAKLPRLPLRTVTIAQGVRLRMPQWPYRVLYLQASRIRLSRLLWLGLLHFFNYVEGHCAKYDHNGDPCCNFLGLVRLVFGMMVIL